MYSFAVFIYLDLKKLLIYYSKILYAVKSKYLENRIITKIHIIFQMQKIDQMR
jgi:hypothetical protein